MTIPAPKLTGADGATPQACISRYVGFLEGVIEGVFSAVHIDRATQERYDELRADFEAAIAAATAAAKPDQQTRVKR